MIQVFLKVFLNVRKVVAVAAGIRQVVHLVIAKKVLQELIALNVNVQIWMGSFQ